MVNASLWPGDRAVDPLMRKQQAAGDLLIPTQVKQRTLQCSGVVKAGEVIECANRKHARGVTPGFRSFQGSALPQPLTARLGLFTQSRWSKGEPADVCADCDRRSK